MSGKENDTKNTTIIGMAQAELIQRHGEATSQMIQAYQGKRYDAAGRELAFSGRSLKGISNYKINPECARQNIYQQAGFTAELLEEARVNQDKILRGIDKLRLRTTDGEGMGNHPQYDLIDVSVDGKIYYDSGMQVKFLETGTTKKGITTYGVIDKLAKDEAWDRYGDKIIVPNEQWEGARQYAKDEAMRYRQTAKNLRERGKEELAKQKEIRAARYEQAGKRIRPACSSREDAVEARLNPEVYVAKSVAKDIHHAGLAAAGTSAIITGGIALAQNTYLILTGDITPKDAAASIVQTTALSGATAYGVGATGTALKSAMHSSESTAVRWLGTTNAPALIVTASIEIAKVVKAYLRGEITETEALDLLGKNGTASIAAGYGALTGSFISQEIAGSLLLKGAGKTVLVGAGGIVGSMIGYTVCASIYDACLQIMHGADQAKKEYYLAKEMADQAIAEMQHRQHVLEMQSSVLAECGITLKDNLAVLMDTYKSTDVEPFIQALKSIADVFGHRIESFSEFSEKMVDSAPYQF